MVPGSAVGVAGPGIPLYARLFTRAWAGPFLRA